jgi:outer membrane protein TolC
MRLFLIPLLLFMAPLHGQQMITLKDAVSRMDTMHPALKAANIRIRQQQTLKPAAVNLPSPQLLFQAPTGNDMRPSILWTTEFPGIYVYQHKAQDIHVELAATERKMKLNELKYELSAWYYEIQYLNKLIGIMQKQDSAYTRLVELNKIRQDKITGLEQVQAESQSVFYHSQFVQTQYRYKNAIRMLNRMVCAPTDSTFIPQDGFVPIAPTNYIVDSLNLSGNPSVTYYNQQVALTEMQVRIERNRAMPGLMAGYFNQGPDNTTSAYYRLNFGITVPLFFWQYTSQIKASKQQVEITKQEAVAHTFNIQLEYAQAQQVLKESREMLNYYLQSGMMQSVETLRNAEESLKVGSINQLDYLRSLEQVNRIECGYVESIFNYNKAALYIEYLNGFGS